MQGDLQNRLFFSFDDGVLPFFFLAVLVRKAEETTKHKSCWVRLAYSVPCQDVERKRGDGRD